MKDTLITFQCNFELALLLHTSYAAHRWLYSLQKLQRFLATWHGLRLWLGCFVSLSMFVL